MSPIRSIAIAALALAATSCASTTIDSAVSEAPVVDTATTLPSGTAAELLPRLLTEVGTLSEIIGSDGRRTEQMATIQSLYDAVRPEIADNDGLAADSFDGALELCKRATRFKRPADADKCFRNLSALSEAYLRNHP